MFVKILLLTIFIGLILLCCNYRYISKMLLVQLSVFLFSILIVLIFFYINTFFILENVEIISCSADEGLTTKITSDSLLRLDFIVVIFSFVVLVIGVFTLMFSLSYMQHEKCENKFILLLILFILSMLLLLCSASLYILILGWELIGLTSFLLINFWHTRKLTLNCAFKAFIFNKCSDLCLLIFYLFVLELTGNSSIDLIADNIVMLTSLDSLSYHSIYFLLYSTLIKSAQIGLHLWLIESMEAPVPASALIHSATLVTAGIFLLILFSDLVELFNIFTVLTRIGLITACFLGISAGAQTDFKKLLAYSTISNCGFMLTCFSINNLSIILIFLALHGFFKAGLFFCVGHFIKYYATQDMRFTGNFIIKDRAYYILFIFCLFNLMGGPLTCGYLSKSLFISELVTFSFFDLSLGLIALLTSLVYTYKLAHTLGNDVAKHFFEKNKFKLQLNKYSNHYNFFSNTAWIHFILIFFVLIAACCIYLYFGLWVFNSVLTYSADVLFINESWNILSLIHSIYNIENIIISMCLLLLLFECIFYFWSNHTFKLNLVILCFFLSVFFNVTFVFSTVTTILNNPGINNIWFYCFDKLFEKMFIFYELPFELILYYLEVFNRYFVNIVLNHWKSTTIFSLYQTIMQISSPLYYFIEQCAETWWDQQIQKLVSPFNYFFELNISNADNVVE